MNRETVICCIKVGTKYSADYVNKLERQIARFTTLPYEFICFTDDSKGIATRNCLDIGKDALPGWWSKLLLFARHPYLMQRRFVYLDLDTVIVDNVDFLLRFKGEFCILQDWWAPTYNSSVMAVDEWFGKQIWDQFSPEVMKQYYGDQDWITSCLFSTPVAVWQERAPNKIASYKADNLQDGPNGHAIVCFHGDPKPHTFKEGWVHDSWN